VEHTEFVHHEISDRLGDQTVHRGFDSDFGGPWEAEDRRSGEEIPS